VCETVGAHHGAHAPRLAARLGPDSRPGDGEPETTANLTLTADRPPPSVGNLTLTADRPPPYVVNLTLTADRPPPSVGNYRSRQRASFRWTGRPRLWAYLAPCLRAC
jgi:hypothetical protein